MLMFVLNCHQVEEFAHINGWEAYPEEEPSTEKPSSKTSSHLSTPITEVDNKKSEQEPAKLEAKETKTEKEVEEKKAEPMEVDTVEEGVINKLCNLFIIPRNKSSHTYKLKGNKACNPDWL